MQCIWKGRRCYKEHQKQQWCWAADAGGEAKDYTLGPRLELILSRVYILVQRVGLFLFSRRPGYLVLAPIPGLSLESANVSSLCPRTFRGGCAKPEAKVQMVAKHSRWPHDNFSGVAPKLERYETEREREREEDERVVDECNFLTSIPQTDNSDWISGWILYDKSELAVIYRNASLTFVIYHYVYADDNSRAARLFAWVYMTNIERLY